MTEQEAAAFHGRMSTLGMACNRATQVVARAAQGDVTQREYPLDAFDETIIRALIPAAQAVIDNDTGGEGPGPEPGGLAYPMVAESGPIPHRVQGIQRRYGLFDAEYNSMFAYNLAVTYIEIFEGEPPETTWDTVFSQAATIHSQVESRRFVEPGTLLDPPTLEELSGVVCDPDNPNQLVLTYGDFSGLVPSVENFGLQPCEIEGNPPGWYGLDGTPETFSMVFGGQWTVAVAESEGWQWSRTLTYFVPDNITIEQTQRQIAHAFQDTFEVDGPWSEYL